MFIIISIIRFIVSAEPADSCFQTTLFFINRAAAFLRMFLTENLTLVMIWYQYGVIKNIFAVFKSDYPLNPPTLLLCIYLITSFVRAAAAPLSLSLVVILLFISLIFPFFLPHDHLYPLQS